MFLDATDYGLSTLGGPGPLSQKFVSPIVGIPKTGQNYSELGLLNPDRVESFSGRSVSSLVDITASDTAYLQAVEDPVDYNEIETTDLVQLTVVEDAQLFNNIDLVDAANLALSETVNIQASGTPDVTPTETASLALTEVAVVDVALDVTDTASLSVTDSGTVDVLAESYDTTDTASLSVSETTILDIFAGVVEIATDDIAALSVSDVAVQSVVVPSNVAEIVFEMRTARMVIKQN